MRTTLLGALAGLMLVGCGSDKEIDDPSEYDVFSFAQTSCQGECMWECRDDPAIDHDGTVTHMIAHMAGECSPLADCGCEPSALMHRKFRRDGGVTIIAPGAPLPLDDVGACRVITTTCQSVP